MFTLCFMIIMIYDSCSVNTIYAEYYHWHIVMLFYRNILTTNAPKRMFCLTWAPARVDWCWRPPWRVHFCALASLAGGDLTIQKWLVLLKKWKNADFSYFDVFRTWPSTNICCFTGKNGEEWSSPMYIWISWLKLYEWRWSVQPGKMLIRRGCNKEYCDLGKIDWSWEIYVTQRVWTLPK